MTTASHAAKVSTSSRLQAVLDVLSDGRWHSSYELTMKTHSVAPHSDLHEIRQNGYPVEQRYNGETPNGRRISEYRLGIGQGKFF
jgi:hypothetical protein